MIIAYFNFSCLCYNEIMKKILIKSFIIFSVGAIVFFTGAAKLSAQTEIQIGQGSGPKAPVIYTITPSSGYAGTLKDIRGL